MFKLDFAKADVKRCFNGDWEVVLTIPRDQGTAVERFWDFMRNNDKPMSAEIDRKRKKRSLDANSYLWVLCQKIADAVGNTKEEVYTEAVRAAGRFELIPIRDDAVEFWIDSWSAKGIGWLAEPSHRHRSKNKGYTVVASYYGSSVYDSRSMSILIDHIVSEAKEIGIETMPPRELEQIKREWGEKE